MLMRCPGGLPQARRSRGVLTGHCPDRGHRGSRLHTNPEGKRPLNASTETARPVGPIALAARERWPLFAALGCGLFAALSDALRPVSAVIDVDDALRRRQIEDLLADNHWFDRTLPFIGAEAPYVSPWSRLVDAPYYLIKRALEPLLGTPAALDVACLIWPALMLLPMIFMLHGTARKLLGREMKPVEAGLFAIFMMQAAVEFAPGRIDHHNVQILLLAAFVRGLTIDDPVWSGRAAGSAAILSLAVGLETVPILAAGLAGLAAMGALGTAAARRRMAAAGGAMLVAAPLAGLVLIGPAGVREVQCDAWSAPWISAAMGGGALLLLSPAVWLRLPAGGVPVMRLASLVGAGLLLIAALAAAFPGCAAGPMQMIDPVTKAFWFDVVAQEQSGLTLVREEGRRAFAVLNCLAIGGLILSGQHLLGRWRQDDSGRMIVWLAVAAGIVMALVAVRYVRISFLLAALVAPLAVAALMSARNSWRMQAGAAGTGAAAYLLAGLSPLGASAPVMPVSHLHLMVAACQGEDTSELSRLPPGVLMAPFGLTSLMLESDNGHRLSAIPFHRSAPGIRQMALAFTSGDPATVRSALAGIDYVAVCAVASPLPMDDWPLYRDLTHKLPRPGFDLVEPQAPSRLLIYRVTPEDI